MLRVLDDPSNVDCVLLVLPAGSAHVDLAKELHGAASQSKQIIVLINKMWVQVKLGRAVANLLTGTR